MSTCLVDGEFYNDITTVSSVVEQLREIADQLECSQHHAMCLYIGNYQVIVDWDKSEFVVIG